MLLAIDVGNTNTVFNGIHIRSASLKHIGTGASRIKRSANSTAGPCDLDEKL